MMRLYPLAIFLTLLASSAAENRRIWTDRTGRAFTAELLACDALRATFDIAGRGKTVVPLAALAPNDAAAARRWRVEHRGAPLIDPACLPPWPADAAAEKVTVQPAAERFTWESPHFLLTADAALPLGVVRDLATVIEATRAVLMAAPLGLHPGDERDRYPVRLFSTPESYTAGGGATGTGGYFDGREMLLLLPNLGIKPGARGLTAEHTRQLFILKHEVTHQLLQPWGWAVLPAWLDEGLAECVASWPYTQGRYTLRGLDTALRDYLLKWRRTTDRRPLTLIPPAQLMALTREAWRDQVAAQSAYDHYNSAALLTHYFLFHDGRGDSASLAACFDAVRRGVAPADAEKEHLLRGRTREQLTAELQKLARRMALEVR